LKDPSSAGKTAPKHGKAMDSMINRDEINATKRDKRMALSVCMIVRDEESLQGR